MKSALYLVMAALLLASQGQSETDKTAPLVVLKFSCGTYKEPSNVIRSVQDPDPAMNEPIRINVSPRNEPQEVKNRRDMAERRAELRGAEINAALSTHKDTKIYFYNLEVRNIGKLKIKSFAWEYQSAGVPDISDRQFYCVINAKPNDKKEFELFTPLSPSRVVDAASAGQKQDNNLKGVVVINKVEYTDGTTWLRRGWNPTTFSAEVMQKVEVGKCVGL